MVENSNEEDIKNEDIKNAEHFIKSIKTDKEYKEENGWHGYYNKEIVELARILEHILSDYKRVLKENEELKEDRDKFKKALGKRITYCNELEKDLFENCSNYVIPIQKVKAKIEELDIEISTCEYADDDSEEYKQEVEKDKRKLLMAKKVLQQLLESEE